MDFIHKTTLYYFNVASFIEDIHKCTYKQRYEILLGEDNDLSKSNA